MRTMFVTSSCGLLVIAMSSGCWGQPEACQSGSDDCVLGGLPGQGDGYDSERRPPDFVSTG